jgi:Glyoxalase-like domain
VKPKLGKNRVHIDVEVPDERSAVDRLVGIGARVLWRQDFQTHYWTVLADPVCGALAVWVVSPLTGGGLVVPS